jgi:protein-disulfide isomerase
LKDDARKLKLDTAAFDQCLDSGSQADVIKTQLSESAGLGVQSTPTFFVNGRVLAGASYDQLKEVIEQELVVAKVQPRKMASR